MRQVLLRVIILPYVRTPSFSPRVIAGLKLAIQTVNQYLDSGLFERNTPPPGALENDLRLLFVVYTENHSVIWSLTEIMLIPSLNLRPSCVFRPAFCSELVSHNFSESR